MPLPSSTTTNVELVELPFDESDRPPWSIKVPGTGLPGSIVPPVALIDWTVPIPPSVAPEETDTALFGWLPSIKSVPELTVVAWLYVLSAVKSTVPLPAVISGSAPEITPPITSVSPEVSTVTVVGAARTIGTSSVFGVGLSDESIDVNVAVLPPLAEIE